MNRPKVIVNCAMSIDGKMALPNRKQLCISSEGDLKRVFSLRNECDAILVGIGTVLSDNPKLTVKEKYVNHPRHPIRVVVDTHAQTPPDAFTVNDKAPTILFTKSKSDYKNIFGSNVEIISSNIDQNGFIDLPAMLQILYEKGVRSLLVEGGGTVIWSFLKQKLVDDFFVFIGSIIIGAKQAPTIADRSDLSSNNEVTHMKLIHLERIDDGVLLHYQLKENKGTRP